MIERIEAPGGTAAFAFLEPLEPPRIVELLRFESPETVAFVLVQLAPGFAAKILMAHEPDRRVDIAQCVATMGTPVPEAAAVVADVLRTRARNAAAKPAGAEPEDEVPAARVQPLVDIMNHAEPAAEGDLLAGLRDRDSDLADQVRAKLLALSRGWNEPSASVRHWSRYRASSRRERLPGRSSATVAIVIPAWCARARSPRPPSETAFASSTPRKRRSRRTSSCSSRPTRHSRRCIGARSSPTSRAATRSCSRTGSISGSVRSRPARTST